MYANPDKPCWLGTAGGTIDGNLIVDGTIQATGTISTPGQVIAGPGMVITESTVGGYQMVTAAGSVLRAKIQHVPAPTNATIISSNDPVVFTQVGSNTGNSSLQTSALGANTDLLTVGGTTNTLKLAMPAAGAAATVGTATIANATSSIIVNTTAVTANSKIFLTHAGGAAAGPAPGAAEGQFTVNPTFLVPGTSFRIDLVDKDGVSFAATFATGVPVNWLIIN